MKKPRLSVDERLARFRRKDAALDALLRGTLLAVDGPANDRHLMTLLLYRRFSMSEIAQIMMPWPHGDTERRLMHGVKYWWVLRRDVLAIDSARIARVHARSPAVADSN